MVGARQHKRTRPIRIKCYENVSYSTYAGTTGKARGRVPNEEATTKRLAGVSLYGTVKAPHGPTP